MGVGVMGAAAFGEAALNPGEVRGNGHRSAPTSEPRPKKHTCCQPEAQGKEAAQPSEMRYAGAQGWMRVRRVECVTAWWQAQGEETVTGRGREGGGSYQTAAGRLLSHSYKQLQAH